MTMPLNYPKRKCIICQKPYAPSYKNQRYCGHKCKWVVIGKRVTSFSMTDASISKRADALRGRGKGKTYTKLRGRHAHRVIAEKILGRPLKKGEVVHHIDHDKKNNAPENLQVLASQAEHARVHFTKHGLGGPSK